MCWPKALATLILAALLTQPRALHAQDRAPLPDLSGIVKDDGWARVLGKALFWDTVAAAKGSGCGGCHFVTGADRQIPDQSRAPLQIRRVSGGGGTSRDSELHGFGLDDSTGAVLDVCSRSVALAPSEVPDSGPIGVAANRVPAAVDPSCRQEVSGRLALSILQRQPLGGRSIGPDDSTFGRPGPHGNLVSPTGRGLDRTYQWMIQQAFDNSLWSAGQAAARDAHAAAVDGSKLERNFPLFWGIALIVYESTLDANWTHRPSHGQTALSSAPPQPGARWE